MINMSAQSVFKVYVIIIWGIMVYHWPIIESNEIPEFGYVVKGLFGLSWFLCSIASISDTIIELREGSLNYLKVGKNEN